MCGKNQVFARQKRQSVHNEGNNALSSRRRNAISCDPSVGDKVESVIFLLIFLIFLRCVNVNYNIVFLIQTSNCGLVIFSALICNFLRLKSEVVFLLILKCVDGFVRKMMMIRTTCILVHRTISEPQISKLLSKDICKKKKKKNRSVGETRIA